MHQTPAPMMMWSISRFEWRKAHCVVRSARVGPKPKIRTAASPTRMACARPGRIKPPSGATRRLGRAGVVL
jgi:hypothetical protein